MMSEKRFSVRLRRECDGVVYSFFEGDKPLDVEMIVELLNEQQELIEELHISDHMGWGRAEKFEKELKQKKIYIKRLEYKVQKFKEMNSEQQATIKQLQDFIGETDAENIRLRHQFKKLKKAIKRAYEEKPYPTIDDIQAKFKELEDD